LWPVAAGLLALAIAGAVLWQRRDIAPAAPSAWVQVTNLPDSATQPALSPDGRILTFIRGPGTFYTNGQIYIKMLPDGEPQPLTRDKALKMSPLFSPDGSRIAYTVKKQNDWDTWSTPVVGGEPQLWLPNASGLIWIDKRRLLFSEAKDKAIHMA